MISNRPNNTNKTNLWVSFKRGDESALKQIYVQFYKPLYNYGRKFSHDIQLVEDSIQELFIELLIKRKHINTPVNVQSYLLKALRNRIFRKLKKAKVHIFLLESDFIELEWPVQNDDPDKEEKRNKLIQAIHSLGNQQKEIIYLKYFNNLDNKEISEVLDIKYQTVRNTLTQSLKKIRSFLFS